MDDQRSRACDEIERAIEGRRIPWAWIVIGLSVAYVAARFAPWAMAGFPLTRNL